MAILNGKLLAKCESPIEAAFANAIFGLVHEAVSVSAQRPIGVYRADFAFVLGDTTAVVECDGRDYHEYAKDARRDVDMLLTGGATDVLRFRGCDIVHRPAMCAECFVRMFPQLTSGEPERPDFEDQAIAARTLFCASASPIYRTTVGQSEITPLVRDLTTFCDLGPTCNPLRRLVQLKSPHWSEGRSMRMRGTGVGIGQLLSEMVR